MIETTIKLAGVSFKNADKTKRQDILGQLYDDFWTEGLEDEITIELRPEPSNKFDAHAVAVWTTKPKEGRGQIGYVPAEHSEYISGVIKSGLLRSAKFEAMGSAKGGRVWASLHLSIASPDDPPEGREEPDETVQADYLVEDDDGRVYDFSD